MLTQVDHDPLVDAVQCEELFVIDLEDRALAFGQDRNG